MSLQFGTTERGKALLLHSGHEYVQRSRERWMIPGMLYWRCRHYRKHRCRASVITEGDRVTKQSGIHTHFGDPLNSQIQQVVNTLHFFSEDSSESVRNSVANAVSQVSDDVLQRLPRKCGMDV